MEDEDFRKLQSDYESLKKIQSGSDRTVTELKKLNTDLLKEKEELESKLSGKTNEEHIKYEQRASFLDRKEKALALSLEKGINPETAFNLLGLNDDIDDEARLDLFNESIQGARYEERDTYARKNGRKIAVSLAQTPLTYKEIMGLSDRNISELPQSVIDNAVNKEMSENKRTFRQKLGGK